jgi:hypothetical protein
MRAFRITGPAFAFFFLLSVTAAQQASVHPVATNGPADAPPDIVIGFLGGFLNHDNSVHGGVKLAARLREDYPSGTYVKVFENHREDSAHKEILRLLDTDHDGTLSAKEKQNARIIIYGHSWGGSETVALARQLEKDGVAVLLTVQVDSVGKFGENDEVIPANVVQAVNFYQLNGMVHGRPKIRAADISRTQIIGNFQYDYAKNPVACRNYPWFARLIENPHIEIECDPALLDHIEALIRSKLPPVTSNESIHPASQ